MQENKSQSDIDKEYHYDNGFEPKKVNLKENYIFYRKDFRFKFVNALFTYMSAFILFFIKLFNGYKVIGAKNLKGHKKGNLILCNHVLQTDALLTLTSLRLRGMKSYVTTLQSNLGFGLISVYFRMGGAVPIPTDIRILRNFTKQTVDAVNYGQNIIFYPEAELYPYCDHIREFKNGIFHFAYSTNATIIPIVYTFHKPKGFRKLFKKKPSPHLNILKPYIMDNSGTKAEIIKKTKNDLQDIISTYFNENNEWIDGKYISRKK